ncbi:MAG: hypothetical protein QOF51_1133, partial [Chloroflexota bacterium]|nr:hypothetical protein [Chloroflexota bacterium]
MARSSPDRQDLLAEIDELLASLGEGVMSETAYETASLMRLARPGVPDAPGFPRAIEWLLANQHDDGSWGSDVPIAKDRLISTLGAILAMATGPQHYDAADVASRRAVVYLNRILPDLRSDPSDTVGFELIIPELVRQARQLDLRLPYEAWRFVDAIHDDKLRRIPPIAVYGGPTPLTHSLEYLGDRLIPGLASRCQFANGSYGVSPSATAFVYAVQPDARSWQYLERVAATKTSGGIPYVHPFEMFETGWVLYYLAPIVHDHEAAHAAVQRLQQGWTSAGAAWTAESTVTDADDTAVAAIVLAGYKYAVDPNTFALFESDEHFLTFALERSPSVTTNAHVLSALRLFSPTPDRRRAILKITQYLRQAREPAGYWLDKWHVSPFYATGEAIAGLAGLAGLASETIRPAIQWILEQQHESGAWGFGEGTQEETAWSVQALLTAMGADAALIPMVADALRNGTAYLRDGLDQRDYPALWVGKTLYTPPTIVRAVILSVLLRYEDIRDR